MKNQQKPNKTCRVWFKKTVFRINDINLPLDTVEVADDERMNVKYFIATQSHDETRL